MGKRQEAAQLTRQKLIDAVIELSKSKSYTEMTIDEITQTANVAKGSFYSYFKRREDIVSEISNKRFDELKNTIPNERSDVADRLKNYLILSSKIIEENGIEIGQQWYRSASSPVKGEQTGMKKIDFDIEFIEGSIMTAVEKGVLSQNTPVHMLALQILSSYYGAVALWCMSDGKISQRNLISEYCEDELEKIIDSYRNPKEDA